MSRSFFTSDEEYIDFLECRCRSLVRVTNGLKGMLEDRNKHISILSADLTKEHDKRVKAQGHIARLKGELETQNKRVERLSAQKDVIRKYIENVKRENSKKPVELERLIKW